MKILHVVASVSKLNFGVWHAAVVGADYLEKKYGAKSELIVCAKTEQDIEPTIPFRYLRKSQRRQKEIEKILGAYSPSSTIIVTHGSWGIPTRIGKWSTNCGFRWMYVPQGMLEPWAFSQKWLLKKVYFNFFEKCYIKKAAVIRAVSDNELSNLKKMLRSTFCKIYNGVEVENRSITKGSDTIRFLFLARLHYKKGILPLVKAWSQVMAKNEKFMLIIIGPDDGELDNIKPYIKGNIHYKGALYGENKYATLKESHYYILPSSSEGFPSSVIEAMSYGTIPIITDGCNTPFVYSEGLGFRIEPTIQSISERLSQLSNDDYPPLIGEKNIKFVMNNFSKEIIGDNLFFEYKRILNERI
jgi:glycosyltransferase involved in cell wall biosynthesis